MRSGRDLLAPRWQRETKRSTRITKNEPRTPSHTHDPGNERRRKSANSDCKRTPLRALALDRRSDSTALPCRTLNRIPWPLFFASATRPD